MPATLTLENHPFHISFMSYGDIKCLIYNASLDPGKGTLASN